MSTDLRMDFAHDMRVPLQLIVGCVQLLEEELSRDSRMKGCLRILSSSAGQLEDMLHRALEEDESRAGRRDVVRIVRDAAREFALLGARGDVKVDFCANVSRFAMTIDGEKLRRVLNNLLSNALRFTPAGGRIGVELRLLGDAVEFMVRDSGCGVPPERRERIFDPGYSTGSTGRGLDIARRCARELGGDVYLADTGGAGSCFVLRIPL